MAKGKGKLGNAEARREYQRQYYLAHKGKAKEYSRLYHRQHSKKGGNNRNRKANIKWKRETTQMTFTQHDLMDIHDDKAARTINKILSGERLFTM
jgi:hypothetical protein